MTSLSTLNDFINALNADLILNISPCDTNTGVTGVSINTRTISPGNIYIPMKSQRDGHLFVADAFAKGAIAAIVDQSFDTSTVDGICLVVQDTLRALQQLAAHNRKNTSAKIIAVTGSIGKTTVKEMIAHLLTSHSKATGQSFDRIVYSRASYNNCWGVPLSLLGLGTDSAFGIFEVGMNHVGEIAPLSQMVQPDVAIITKIAAAHIGHMGSIDAIAKEKSQLITGLKPGGDVLLYDAGDMHHYLLDACKEHHVSDAHITTLYEHDATFTLKDGCTYVKATINSEPITYTLPFVAPHQITNSMIALQACALIGISPYRCAPYFESFNLPTGRGGALTCHIDNVGDITLIDDAYNANPESMKSALLNLKNFKGRKVAILGEMRELGANSDAYHLALKSIIVQADIASVICCGTAIKCLYDVLPIEIQGAYSDTPDELITKLPLLLEANDTVFVKGSNGSKVHMISKYLKEECCQSA